MCLTVFKNYIKTQRTLLLDQLVMPQTSEFNSPIRITVFWLIPMWFFVVLGSNKVPIYLFPRIASFFFLGMLLFFVL